MQIRTLVSKLAVVLALAATVVIGSTTFAAAQVDCSTTSTVAPNSSTTVVDPYDPYGSEVVGQSASGAAVPAQVGCTDGGTLPLTGGNAVVALGAAGGLLGLALLARRAAQSQI